MAVAMAQIVFIDIEASGLEPSSFPVELGWATLDGGSGAWLIKPASNWSAPGWDQSAAELHRIGFEQLRREGREAWQVAGQLNWMLDRPELVVLSDAPEMDGFWLDRLFEQSPLTRGFALVNFANALQTALNDKGRKHRLELPEPDRAHRAEADALQLMQFWREALAE